MNKIETIESIKELLVKNEKNIQTFNELYIDEKSIMFQIREEILDLLNYIVFNVEEV